MRMNLLTAEQITKSYTDKVLLNHISLGIQEGDKIGVIGVNGTGKSTFLKIIAGLEKPEEGNIAKMNGLQIAYLPQMPDFKEDTTVLRQVFSSENPKLQLVGEYEDVLLELEKNPGKEDLIQKAAALGEKIEEAELWGLESEAKNILTRLGITDFHKKVSHLSGGGRKRVAMAAAFISPVDLLILDEPTNHIDSTTVSWLEEYLKKYTKALLMVTHDRYFLDRVVNKTIEIEKGQLYEYQGNYSQFLELKAQREELLVAGERKRQNFLRRELEWVRRGAQARSTKQKARLERFEEVSSEKAPSFRGNVEINIGASRLGRKIIEAENISKRYGEKTYIDNFSYILLRDDRIGIIGPNGCGKSTLVKLLTGRLPLDGGKIEIGETVKIGVFSQESTEMNPSQRVIDYIKETGEYVKTADGKVTASQMLEKFLFEGDIQYSPISKLSGGERRRLYLLKVLMEEPNVLFLDEPTNDLDIETLSILEEYLDSFSGAVVAVSHDRYFLDRVANRIFAFEGEGKIRQYEGNYSDYEKIAKEGPAPEIKIRKAEKKEENTKKESKKLKFSFHEQREFESIGEEIASIENEVKKVEEEMEQTLSDYVLLQELTLKKEALEETLEEKMERWVYLNELAEEIEKNKKEAKGAF